MSVFNSEISVTKIKIMNSLLILCFLYARGVDYVSTYIMISLGATEINPVVDWFVIQFGVVEGLVVMFFVAIVLCLLFGIAVFKSKTLQHDLFISLILSIVVFVSIVVVAGNLCGLAYVIASMQGG